MVDENLKHSGELFPSSYISWRYCVEVKCGLSLTPQYLQERISVLGDRQHEESRRFAKLYGDDYREQVFGWFQRVAAGG